MRWKLLDAVSTPNLESIARCLTLVVEVALIEHGVTGGFGHGDSRAWMARIFYGMLFAT